MTVRKSSNTSDTTGPATNPITTDSKESVTMTQNTATTTAEKAQLNIVSLPLSVPGELWFSGYDKSKLLSLVVNPGHPGGDAVTDNRMTLKAAYAYKDLAIGAVNVVTPGLHTFGEDCCDDDNGGVSKLYKDAWGIIGPQYDGSDSRFGRIIDGNWHLIRLINGQPRVDVHPVRDGQELKHVLIDMMVATVAAGKTLYIQLGKNKRERVLPITNQLIVAVQDKGAARKMRINSLNNLEQGKKEGRMNTWASKPENAPAFAEQAAKVADEIGGLPTGKIAVTFQTPGGPSNRSFDMSKPSHQRAFINAVRLNKNYEVISTVAVQ